MKKQTCTYVYNICILYFKYALCNCHSQVVFCVVFVVVVVGVLALLFVHVFACSMLSCLFIVC